MGCASARIAILFTLIAGHGLCQSDATVYESFLGQVATWQVGGLPRPTPREAIGLSEQEAGALNALAAEYESKDRSYREAVGSLRLEALFQSIESGQASEKLARRMRDLGDEHTQMVLGQEKLRAAFGDSRFQVLQGFIRSKGPGSPYFPSPGAPKAKK